MKLFKNRAKYDYVFAVSRFLSPAATAAFYVSIVSILLLVIISVIVFFVNVTVDNMLLPPFMKETISAGQVPSYTIDFSVGITVVTPRIGVTLGDIKAVIYAFTLFLIASLVMFTPIFKFLSKFFRNIAEKNLFSEDNARMINRVGVAVIIGNIIVELAYRFYIFTLANTFLSIGGRDIDISLGFNWNSLIVGGFIIILGSVYGCACEHYRKTNATNAITTVE